MTTATYDTFFPEVLPHVPACSEMAAFNAVRNAVIQFCTDTWYLQYDCYPIPVMATIPQYEPDTPNQTKFVGVVDAFFGSKPLYPKDEATLRRRFGSMDFRLAQGTPDSWYQTDPDSVLLVPCPDALAAQYPLNLRIAIAPTRDSTGVDDTVYERYAETVAKGAIARLKAVPGQLYSDQQGAQAMATLFKKEIFEVRSLVERNQTRGPLRVRFNGRNP